MANPKYESLMELEDRPKERLQSFYRKDARLITIEEHCTVPLPLPKTSITFSMFTPKYLAALKQRLTDIEKRIQIMDANNIQAQIISLNQPGAQAFTDADECANFCRTANHFIYENYVQKYPKRFFGFAILPTQSGKAAALELERCVKEYGFVGSMVNGFTNTSDTEKGLYLDDEQFDALWEVAERLETPIFIHPRTPLPANIRNLEDMPIFHGSPYGFGRETVEHCLRLMYHGVFDRFPGLKICLGHMGEGLSWILPRTDSTFRIFGTEARGQMKRTFCDYLQNNFLINTSGVPRISALQNLLAETRVENVMFSVDYPYESIAEMRQWFESVAVSDEVWKDIGYRNSIKWFKLPLDCE